MKLTKLIIVFLLFLSQTYAKTYICSGDEVLVLDTSFEKLALLTEEGEVVESTSTIFNTPMAQSFKDRHLFTVKGFLDGVKYEAKFRRLNASVKDQLAKEIYGKMLDGEIVAHYSLLWGDSSALVGYCIEN